MITDPDWQKHRATAESSLLRECVGISLCPCFAAKVAVVYYVLSDASLSAHLLQLILWHPQKALSFYCVVGALDRLYHLGEPFKVQFNPETCKQSLDKNRNGEIDNSHFKQFKSAFNLSCIQRV